MASDDVLSLLKYATPVIGLLSVIWSTTQKLTFEDAAGAKRLTLPGRIMIGFNIVAAAVSLLAIGFDSVVRQQQAEAEAAVKAAATREAADKERRKAQVAEAQRQADSLARIEADAKEQSRFLEQRFLIVSNAAAQQRRDAAVSLELARQSAQRLSEAERTLAEFERINYPLRSLEAFVALELNFANMPELAPLWAEIQGRTDLASRLAIRGLPEGGRIITFRPSDIRANTANRLPYATTGTQIQLAFLSPEEAARLGNRSAAVDIQPIGDARRPGPQWVGVTIDTLEADTRDRTITAYFSGTYEAKPEGMAPTGEKLSVAEVARLVPVLTIARGESNPAGRRPPDRLVRVRYLINGTEALSAAPRDIRISGSSMFFLGSDRRR